MSRVDPQHPVEMSEAEYHEHARQDAGLCLSCGSLESSGVEPDAEEYECEECGACAVQGLENALCDGHIAITGEGGDEPADEH